MSGVRGACRGCCRPRVGACSRRWRGRTAGSIAMVVGEYERAFAGHQLQDLLPVLRRFGVALWLPETCGPVEEADPAHQALLMLLGYQSRREVLRSRFRTAAAMRVQARDQIGRAHV